MRSVAQHIAACGYAFVPAYLPQLNSVAVASHVGQLQQLASIAGVQSLRPYDVTESTPNLYSGNYGRGEFPLHTDLAHWFIPPRFIMLRAVYGHASMPTPVVRRADLWSPSELTSLARARFVPRRALMGRLQLLPFLQSCGTHDLIRWDSLFLVPDNDEANQVARRIAEIPTRCIRSFSLVNCGDTLLLDNWKVLHGRSKVPDGADRHIERIYLSRIYPDA